MTKAKSSRQVISHFSRRLITHLVTHRKIKIQTFSGETVRMCRLAWSFAARLRDKNLNELVSTIWPKPSFTSLLFSATSQGSGETPQMSSLARSFATRIYDIFHELGLKFSLSLHLHPLFFRDFLFAYAISTKLY